VESVLNQILESAQRQGAAAEVFYLEEAQTPIEFETNRLKGLQTKALQGIALRVIYEGKLGFASSTDLQNPEQLVAAALATSRIGDLTELSFAEAAQIPTLAPDTLPLPSTAQLVEEGKRLIAELLDFNPDLLVSAGFTTHTRTKTIATSAGAYYTSPSQTVSASLAANWVRGEDLLDVYSYRFARNEPLDCDGLLAEIKNKLTLATTTAVVQSGTLPVIFTPQAFALVFGGMLQALFAGQSVFQGISPLGNKVGQQLFDPRLNLYQDPTQGVSRSSVDDEGTPTQVNPLIRAGIVEGFYWDRTWAKRAGVAPTGNGYRSGLGRPSPSLSNLCIAPGNVSFAEMVASLDEGIVVEQVLGAGQSNLFAGEFSVNLDLGYKVEKGQIVGRAKNTMVAGNLFRAFQQIEALGSERTWAYGSAWVPPILLGELGVTSRAT